MIRKFLRMTALFIAGWVAMSVLVLASVEALEVEATGECRECWFFSR